MVASVLAARGAPRQKQRLCIVWSSADPDVAKSTCFMYALNAKRFNWFDEVHVIVWGPSARLLVKDESVRAHFNAARKMGVKMEACLLSAKSLGVDQEMKKLGLKVGLMGIPLSARLKSGWKVITF